MTPRLRDLPLAARLGVLAAGLVGALGWVLVADARASIERVHSEAARERGIGVARVLASALAPYLDFDDARGASELLALTASAPEVSALGLFRLDGSPLADWNDPVLRERDVRGGGQLSAREEGDLLRVTMPVLSRAGGRGVVVVEYSLRDWHERVAATQRRATQMTVAICGLALVLAAIAGRFLTAPIVRVTRVAERLVRGDEDARRDLPLERGDEVGRMAGAIDRMLGKLQRERAHLGRQGRQLAGSLRELRATQAQLIQAGKMAAVGTLVAGLSHELNTPLGVILGHAQGLARRCPADHPDGAPLGAIVRQARRCKGLVRTLLDFSRAGPAGRETLDAGLLVERVEPLAIAHAKPRRVRIECRCDPGLPVRVNSEELETAILNLVKNAVDASAEGEAVRVVARRDGARVLVEVEDRGPGIPPELRERIYDPFFTTKAPGEGTGLGLALAQRFVEGHGGAIALETAPGRGTTFRLELPLAAPDPV